MMSFYFILILITLLTTQALDTTLTIKLEKDKPSLNTLTPVGLYGDVNVEVIGTFDKTLVVCLNEMTNAPFRTKYSTCTQHFELVPESVTTTSSETNSPTTPTSSGTSSTYPEPTSSTAPEPTSSTAPAPTSTTAPAPTSTSAPAPTSSTAPAPTSTTAPAPTSSTVAPTSTTAEPTSSTVAPTSTTAEPTSSTVAPTSTTAEPTSSTVAPTTSSVAPTTSSTVAPTTSSVAPTTSTSVKPTTSTESTTTTESTTSASTTESSFKRAIVASEAHTVVLRNVLYHVAVYFKTEPGKDAKDAQNFQLKFTGKTCAEGKTGPNCQIAVNTWKDNTTATFEAGKKYYYKVNVPASNKFTISTKNEFTYQARFGAVPYGTHYDITATGKALALPSPRIGVWYIIAVPNKNGTDTLKASGTTCGDDKAGSDCKSKVIVFSKKSTVNTTTLEKEAVQYFSVQGTVDSLLVSARTVKKSDKQPKLYAAFNRAPQFDAKKVAIPGTYDISGCNVETCKLLNQLSLKTEKTLEAVNGTWFIAVQAQEKGSVLVWADNICPNDCSGHGECTKTGNDFGSCVCKPSYNADLLCSYEDFLVEYIILIVIAALVAISAIIGLVAWAYMKSKHRGYEPV